MTNPNGFAAEKMNEFKWKIPIGAEELSHQIAGHRFGQSKHKFGILRHSESGDILKPVCDKRSQREQLLYEAVFSKQNDDDPCIVAFRNLVPRYKGLFRDEQMNINYIRLEDITASLTNISLLDIKMGKITYDPEASEDKIHSEENKYRHAKDLGFRILGMRFYDQSTKSYQYKNKDFGLHVDPENAHLALKTFTQSNAKVLKQFIEQLKEIEIWFRNYNIDRWKFFSSSLLFSYGFQSSDETKTGNLKTSDSIQALVKMIDFAHVFPNVGYDENYLFGLEKLICTLQRALDSCVQ